MQGREISVAGVTYFMQFELLELSRVVADIPNNPRFNSLGVNRPTTIEDMLLVLESDKRFHRLKESVISNQGITDPIIVEPNTNGKGFNLREGFQRTLIYKMNSDQSWARRIPAYIFPADMPEVARRRHIQTLHNVGKSDWDKITKVMDAMSFQLEFGGTDKEIAEANGYEGGESEYRFHRRVYERCRDYVRATKDKDYRWSHWFEILKSSEQMSIALSKKLDANKKNAYKVMKNRLLGDPKKSRKMCRLLDNPEALAKLANTKPEDTQSIDSILGVAKRHRSTIVDTTIDKLMGDMSMRINKRNGEYVRVLKENKKSQKSFKTFLKIVTKLAVNSGHGDTMLQAVLEANKGK
jgi:ribosomal protein L17